jgi:putative ABC transport system permease protein
MQIPFIAGRDFTSADNDAAPRVVIVNQSFARQFLGAGDPIGQRMRPALSTTEKDTPWREVIGVVADVKQRSLDEAGRPQYFVPYAQGLVTTLFLVMRTAAPPAAAAEQARQAIARKDPELAIYDVRTMEDYVALSTGSARFQTQLLTLFAALALVLTAVGLYGVVAYGVAQRTREFGIRLALGADPRRVLRLVLGQGLRLAVIGVTIGVAAAAFATRLLVGSLYGVAPLDPATFAAVAFTLLFVAAAASFVPARRATRVDPIRALRAD